VRCAAYGLQQQHLANGTQAGNGLLEENGSAAEEGGDVSKECGHKIEQLKVNHKIQRKKL
jgi:hypothetical protein